jgi:hypothetical protein
MKGKIGDAISYAPMSSQSTTYTDLTEIYRGQSEGKAGTKTTEWDVWIKTTDWYQFQQRNK